jgi:uncharacterized protein YhbP (UPF0306 family)
MAGYRLLVIRLAAGIDKEATMDPPKFAAIHTEDVTGRDCDRVASTSELVSASLFKILAANVLCSIATVTPEGRPHINTIFQLFRLLDLYFLLHPESRHSLNLSNSSSVALTVFFSAQQWTQPDQGIQLFGTCKQATGSLIDEAERSYANRFHAYATWRPTIKRNELASQYRFYVVHATELKILNEIVYGEAAFVRASGRRGA